MRGHPSLRRAPRADWGGAARAQRRRREHGRGVGSSKTYFCITLLESQCCSACHEQPASDARSAGVGLSPQHRPLISASVGLHAGKRGAGSSRSDGVAGSQSGIAPKSACGSANLAGGGRRRRPVTRHPRKRSHRIHCAKSGSWWTRHWSCHAPPSDEDCPGFGLDRADFRGQKVLRPSPCHAPPSTANRAE